jgi:hypothetical protein
LDGGNAPHDRHPPHHAAQGAPPAQRLQQ